MKGLAPQQVRVLAIIRESISTHGRPPTLREIAEKLGVNHANGIQEHLERLESKGEVQIDRRRARGIRLTRPTPQRTASCCPRCGLPATGVYRCLSCRRYGCSSACLGCDCVDIERGAA